MKKLFVLLVLLVLTVGAISAQELTFDEAVNYAARAIEEDLPQRALVLILNVKSPSENFANSLLNGITDQLVIGRKVQVVDRQNLEAIRAETNFQYSGEVSDESMVSIGRMLGAQFIVTGVTEESVNDYRIRFRSINIETTRIHSSIIVDIKKDVHVMFLIGGDSAVQEMKRIEQTRPTSNVRNNWLSADISGGFNLFQGAGLSIGAQYERMLSSKVSLGAHFYYFIPFSSDYHLLVYEYEKHKIFLDGIDKGNIFGIDAFFRLYPAGRKFFLGLALGFHNGGNYAEEHDSDSNNRWWIESKHGAGFAITGEIGWKIDVGKEGGFFVQPGFLGTFIVGSSKRVDIDKAPNFNLDIHGPADGKFSNGYWRLYLSAGYAF